jgi:hypothetical protein
MMQMPPVHNFESREKIREQAQLSKSHSSARKAYGLYGAIQQ